MSRTNKTFFHKDKVLIGGQKKKKRRTPALRDFPEKNWRKITDGGRPHQDTGGLDVESGPLRSKRREER